MKSSSWREGNNERGQRGEEARRGTGAVNAQGTESGEIGGGGPRLNLPRIWADATNFTRAAADASTAT